MILFTILAIMAIIAVIAALVFTGVFGGAMLVALGDVIVCVLIVVGLLKLIFGRKK